MPNSYTDGPFIDSVTLPSGSVYWLKDKKAREDISNITGTITGAMHYEGVTTTPLTDGATTTTLVIGGESKTFNETGKGAVVIYDDKEFIWSGSVWNEFGSTGSLKALAFKNNASGSTTYTPSGNVTVSTVNATAIVSTVSGTTTYKPAGTVSQPTFTGSSFNSTGSYTPAGTVSQPTFTGTSFNSTGSYTPAGNVSVSTANKTATVSTASGSTTYKPAGSVTAPTISVATAGATASIKNPTAVNVTKTVDTAAPGATAPANAITYASVSNENLSFYQIGYTTGNSITTSDVTVKTGDASYSASQPTFNGTATRLVTGNIAVTTAASFSGTSATVTVSGTPTGSVSQPTFEGTSATVTVSGTPTGSVSQPTFDGTGVRLKTGNIVTTTAASFTGTSGTIDITVS